MRREKGITLIALIVTIIILLILAGVAIVTLTGENGLLKRANEAVEKTKEAEAVEVIELQLMSCRVEYTLNSNVDIPTYVEKENKNIETQIDAGNGGDGTPLSNWLMTYGGYEFEIYDLQIQGYYKEGNKVRPTIKDKKVTEEYQFASINGSKVDVEFKVELPTELSGATVNVNVTSQATGVVNGSYDNATGIYTGTITTDGTINTNGTYTYEVKATKDGKDYTVKTTVKISKFLDDLKVEVPEEDKKLNELKIKVTNNYPQDANMSYKYYISETETYGTEEFTTDTEVTKTGLKSGKQYNIKVEAYLSDQTTMIESIIQAETQYVTETIEVPQNENLVEYWALQGSTRNLIQNSEIGDLIPFDYTPEFVDGSIQFNGTGGLRSANKCTFPEEFTISLDVNGYFIFGILEGSTRYSDQANGILGGHYFNGVYGNGTAFKSPTDWCRVIVTGTAQEWKVYRDGNYESKRSGYDRKTGEFFIGRVYGEDPSNRRSSAAMKNFAIYNKAYSEEEIKANFFKQN